MIWIGTSRGASIKMKGNEISRHAGATHDEVLALEEGHDGSLWVGMGPRRRLEPFLRTDRRTCFSGSRA